MGVRRVRKPRFSGQKHAVAGVEKMRGGSGARCGVIDSVMRESAKDVANAVCVPTG